MEIESIRHRALRAFFETDKSKGLIEAERIRRIFAFILIAENFDMIAVPPNFGFHPLAGDRKGEFAMTVTRNWRLTFRKFDDRTVADLDLEDYH